MAILTANDFAQQMIAQLRVLDPSVSAEIGTPERKIIDTVASILADNQIDLTGLSGALDIDSKFGTSLDRFTQLFGFQRQQSTPATGYVVFSRNSPAPTLITIPVGVVLQSNVTSSTLSAPMQYQTVASGTISQDGTTSTPIPVQAITTGQGGNTADNTITIMVGTPVAGVTAVTNPAPLVNGLDGETDDVFKVRFKNTWARNLAGTEDQFLALAVAGAFTTKANVIGTQSRYREYIQVPDFDDAGYVNGAPGALFGGTAGTQNVLGSQNQWTSALSVIPYAKQIYRDTQVFVSNGQSGPIQFFYRPDADFTFHATPKIAGDVIRNIETTVTGSLGGGQQTTASNTLSVVSTVGFPTQGTLIYYDSTVAKTTTYTGLSQGSPGFLGVPNGLHVDDGTPIYFVPSSSPIEPNFTFLNVYNPSVVSDIPNLQAITPQQILLSEFSYVSTASRNDLDHNVDNAVDIYIDGTNDIQGSCVFLTAPPGVNQIFVTDGNSPWYYENYRRDGEPAKRPQLGNVITPLFQTPIDSIPDSININNENYFLGIHYWLVHEIGPLGGSIRSRDGIEWSALLPGDLSSQPPASLLPPYFPGGHTFNAQPSGLPISVNNYTYDANIPTLQATMESARQVTTDVLVHRAVPRYFKLDITLSYSSNSNYATVNTAVFAAVQQYFDQQYFGAIIHLSTLLEIVHNVPGVDNVRWSNDLLIAPDLIRVVETDIDGNPLHGASIDRLVFSGSSVTEIQTLYIVGTPTGTFTLTWSDPGLGSPVTTAPINFTHQADGTPVTAGDIQSAVRSAFSGVSSGVYNHNTITVTEDSRPTLGVSRPIRSFSLKYGANGQPYLPTINQTVTSSTFAYDSDYFLLDDELPQLPVSTIDGDTLPGFIIRPRAQNTFIRPGLG